MKDVVSVRTYRRLKMWLLTLFLQTGRSHGAHFLPIQ
jgi:Ni,Fe-hydrogenase I cytochrome b subunit